MFTRSTRTPGTVRINANGSRLVGIFVNSSEVKLTAVPVDLGSMIGASPLTVIVSAIPAIFVVILRSTVLPTATTILSWTIVENPASAAVSLYGPGARSRNRKPPSVPVTVSRVASTP